MVLFSSVQATRYRMLVDGSITGVLRMPRLPTMLRLPAKANLAYLTGTAPTLLAKSTAHSCTPLSASKAKSVSLIVAMYTTLWVPRLGTATFGTYSGWAKMTSSTGSLNTRPNVAGETLDVLRVTSVRFAPETPASYPRCRTGCAVCAIGPTANASASAATPMEPINPGRDVLILTLFFLREEPEGGAPDRQLSHGSLELRA